MMLVSRSTHSKIAFFIWAVVGLSLSLAGACFLQTSLEEGSFSFLQWAGLWGAVALGLIKGLFVLPKVADRNTCRMRELPDQSPLYTTFSLRSWILVLVMILMGRLIRAMGASPFVMGAIYIAVGMALLLASRAYLQRSA